MRRRIVAFGIAAVLSMPALLVASPRPAEANHPWGNYHWAWTNDNAQFTLKLGDNVSSTWDPHLALASSDWTTPVVSGVPDVLNLQVVAGETSGRRCRPTNGRVEACSATYGNNGWLGLAQIWVSGNHITQGVAKMNDTYFNSPPYNTAPWRQFVMCQEVGHTFGLGHQDEDYNNTNLGSCMDYGYPLGPPSNEHPNKHDYDQLGLIYNHSDPSTTIRQDTPSGPGRGQGQDGGNNPSDWGVPVRNDRHGTPILYRKDLGGNDQQFTWVFWARQQGTPNRP